MTKYDGQGQVIESETRVLTVFFARKIGLPNYSNKEASVHLQVPIEPTDEWGEIETKTLEAFAFVEQLVGNQLQLGVEYSESAAEIVAPKAATGSAASKPSATASGGDDKDALWQDLIDNPNNWFDNRSSAKGNQPQFKGKRSSKFDGRGLWLNSAPEWAKDALNGKVSA